MARTRPKTAKTAKSAGGSGKSATGTNLFARERTARSRGAAGGASGGAGGSQQKRYPDDFSDEEEEVSFLLFRDDPRKPHASARSADIEAVNADPRLTQEFVPAIRL